MESIFISGLPSAASRIGLGTRAIGGWMWGGTDTWDAVRTIHEALDQGINLIDTAPACGFGRSEELVGQALMPRGRRAQAMIATKVGVEWINGKIYRNSRPERIRIEVENSLRRLGTDYIDLYQVHWPDPSVPVEETAWALGKLLQEGKIRAIGVSNYSVEQIAVFQEVAPIQAVQLPLNIFERTAERDVISYARQHGMTVLAYGALCRGLLTGTITYTTKFQGHDLRKMDPKFQPPRLGQYLAAVAQLERLARDRYGKPLLALAIRWVIDHGSTIALWGARRPEQLAPAADVMGWHIDSETLDEIDRIVHNTVRDPVGPEFMAPAETPPADRLALSSARPKRLLDAGLQPDTAHRPNG
jgi:aryl-alcohol dehydrogenase-like predicted oxidoreductase